MLGLAIHTSSPQLGLMLASVSAVANESDNQQASRLGSELANEPVNRAQVWDLGREVSSQFHVKLIEFMQPYSWQDLSFVAVAKGPGGFTGTRFGVVVARTLAQQLSIPLFGISSLAALAAGEATHSANADIAVMMPANREAVYGAIYRPDGGGSLQPVLADAVIAEAEWHRIVADWPQPLNKVSTAAGEGLATSVSGVMSLATVQWQRCDGIAFQGDRPDWSTVMPFYGQHPVHR
jgi:tRNA threonylcarbamoyl adenosine modification protein YeaZ